MKKLTAIPILSAAGGIACFLLRCVQNRTGFEPDTGLPVTGDPIAVLLPILLLALTAAVAALAWRLPDEKEDCPQPFGRQFAAAGMAAPALAVGGIFLWALSGAADLLLRGQANVSGLYYAADVSAARIGTVLGLVSIAGAACLLPAVAAARRRDGEIRPRSELALTPVVCLVVRLAFAYREMSVNASQQAYYPALLALMLLILCLFRLSSFAFRCGKTRRFTVYSAAAAILCITALADAASLSQRLFLAGGAAIALGFQLLRLTAFAQESE